MNNGRRCLREWLDEKIEEKCYFYCCQDIISVVDGLICNMCADEFIDPPRYQSENFDYNGVYQKSTREYVKMNDEYFIG